MKILLLSSNEKITNFMFSLYKTSIIHYRECEKALENLEAVSPNLVISYIADPIIQVEGIPQIVLFEDESNIVMQDGIKYFSILKEENLKNYIDIFSPEKQDLLARINSLKKELESLYLSENKNLSQIKDLKMFLFNSEKNLIIEAKVIKVEEEKLVLSIHNNLKEDKIDKYFFALKSKLFLKDPLGNNIYLTFDSFIFKKNDLLYYAYFLDEDVREEIIGKLDTIYQLKLDEENKETTSETVIQKEDEPFADDIPSNLFDNSLDELSSGDLEDISAIKKT